MSKQKLLITGVTGYVGSHILLNLFKSPSSYAKNLKIIGTCRSLQNVLRVTQFNDAVQPFNQNNVDFELGDADMTADPTCFNDYVKDSDYVIHTACPFMN